MNLTNVKGFYGRFKTLLLNGFNVVNTGDDYSLSGAINFDVSTSGFFGVGDSSDPGSIDPTFGMYVTDQQILMGAESLGIGGSLSFDCGGIYGYSHTPDDIIIARSTSALSGPISILNSVGNITLDVSTGNKITAGSREIMGFEKGSNANGEWTVYYDSRGQSQIIEQSVRISVIGASPALVDFPITWPSGFEYNSSCVITDITLVAGTAPFSFVEAAASDDDQYSPFIVDGITSNPMSGQLDIIFRGQRNA